MPRLRASLAALTCAIGAAIAPIGVGVTASHASPTATSSTPLALTPPMGWNDWAHYECNFNEQTITSNADALVSTGLAAKGYTTVTVDDCWMASSRSNGHLVADPVKFPHGMAWLGTYLHNKGLKFGIYEDAGTSTCGGYPGSQGYWTTDANDFAAWGVDYLKLDGCNVSGGEPGYRSAYSAMSDALRATGRPIVFSESAPAYFQGTSTWYTVLGWVGQYGQLWREGADIATYNGSASRWSSVMYNYGYNRDLQQYESPGNWNDPDFLIAGDGGLTDEESRSQVALWAMEGAPMILSSNVSSLTAGGLAALGNTDLIAVDQDTLGKQAAVVSTSSSTDVLNRTLANGDHAVAILNRTGSAATTSVSLASLGLGSCSTVSARNLWTGATSTVSSLSASVPGHGTAVWRISGCTGGGGGGISGVHAVTTGGKALDDPASSTAAGTQLITWTAHGGANQQWTFTQQADGSYTLVNGVSGLCVDVSGGSTAAGAKVIQYTCTGGTNQEWTATAIGGGLYTLKSVKSGLLLTTASTADGSLVTQQADSNSALQHWTIA